MLSIAFVSRPRTGTKGRTKRLKEIQSVSSVRNSKLNITGLLIATIPYFAEVLEGPQDAVETVMKSIQCDRRHHEIVEIRRSVIESRRFWAWGMARFGREEFVDASLTPLLKALHSGSDKQSVARFDQLVEAIARLHHKSL